MAACEPSPAVLRSVLACTDRHPIPPAGSHPMHILPAPRTPLGEANDADRARACDRLSAVHGRRITGGWSVDQLAAEYALLYQAGFEAGQQATA